MFDLLLKNGDVYDGSGRVVCGQDIAIQDGMIVDIGKNLTGIAQQTIDASGLIVSPGFIDMHTHSDFTLIADVSKSQIVYREYREVDVDASDANLNSIIYDSFKIISN